MLTFFYTRCMNPLKCSATVTGLGRIARRVAEDALDANVAGISYDPGFDRPAHPGFRRAVSAECLFCHNAYPAMAPDRRGEEAVFPDALPKVYVTASAEERARRRYKQLIEKGNPVTLAGLLRGIRERDARDSARAAAPLRTAADAIVLDTTDMSIEASVAFVLDRFRALRSHSEC